MASHAFWKVQCLNNFPTRMARALQNLVYGGGSMVMVYIGDIFITTKTVEDHMKRLHEVCECLPEAVFKIQTYQGIQM